MATPTLPGSAPTAELEQSSSSSSPPPAPGPPPSRPANPTSWIPLAAIQCDSDRRGTSGTCGFYALGPADAMATTTTAATEGCPSDYTVACASSRFDDSLEGLRCCPTTHNFQCLPYGAGTRMTPHASGLESLDLGFSLRHADDWGCVSVFDADATLVLESGSVATVTVTTTTPAALPGGAAVTTQRLTRTTVYAPETTTVRGGVDALLALPVSVSVTVPTPAACHRYPCGGVPAPRQEWPPGSGPSGLGVGAVVSLLVETGGFASSLLGFFGKWRAVRRQRVRYDYARRTGRWPGT